MLAKAKRKEDADNHRRAKHKELKSDNDLVLPLSTGDAGSQSQRRGRWKLERSLCSNVKVFRTL